MKVIMWCMYNIYTKQYSVQTLRHLRSVCVSDFMHNAGPTTWKEYREDYGWRCEKVFVKVESMNSKN